MAKFFRSVAQFFVAVYQVAESLLDHSGARPACTKMQLPPLICQPTDPSVPLPEALPLEEPIITASPLVPDEPLIVPVAQPVVATPAAELMPQVKREEVKPQQESISLPGVKLYVERMFNDYVHLLESYEFKLAAQVRGQIRTGRVGDYSTIWVLEQLIAEGELDEHIPHGQQFFWNEGGIKLSSVDWWQVPEKKRAISLLFALNDKYWAEMQAERSAREAEKPARPVYRNPITGFCGRKTGKTERDRAKAKGPKPARVGPAKGKSPGKPRHGH